MTQFPLSNCDKCIKKQLYQSEFEGVGAGEECSQPSQIFEFHIGGNASFFHSLKVWDLESHRPSS